MQPLPLIVALVSLAAVAGFVLAPLVRATGPAGEPATTGGSPAVERRDRALAALRELEFDHRTGKLTGDDYALQLGPLRSEAAAALQALATDAPR